MEKKKMEKNKKEKLTYTVEEAGELLGISRGTAYALAREGRLPVIRISDRRWVVPKAQLERLLNGATDGSSRATQI